MHLRPLFNQLTMVKIHNLMLMEFFLNLIKDIKIQLMTIIFTLICPYLFLPKKDI